MARPRNADKTATWSRIVQAARCELFTTPGGAAELSIRSVAQRAGVGVGTVQYYFSSKEALLEACLDEYYVALEQIVRELVELAAGMASQPRTFVELATRRLYRFVRAERPHVLVRVATNVRRGGLPPERQGAYIDDLSALLAPMFGIDPFETRMTFQTMSFVMMQYAVLSDDDVHRLIGQRDEAGRAGIEDHVVRVALRLVFPSDASLRPE